MPIATKELEIHYEAVPFSLTQYDAMKELFASAFGTDITKTAFQKRFDTRRLGADVVGFIAVHRATKTPAAYYGVFPVKILWQGKIIQAAQSGDTMTHGQHRKKGLFTWLAQKTFEQCEKRGIALVFGLPNKNSYHGFINRLGWRHIDNVATYDLKLPRKTIPLAKLFLKAGLFSTYLKLAKLVLEKRLRFDITAFYNPLDHYARVNRDADYLAYKADGTKIFLRLDDVTLWVRLTDVFWIGDMDKYERFTETSIQKLKRIARLLGYNTIRFHFNEGLPQPRFLRWFVKQDEEPSCYYYIDERLDKTNLLLTAADFDTW